MKNNKRRLESQTFILLIIGFLGILSFSTILFSNSNVDLYKVANKSTMNEIFNNQGDNIYYFYQEDCGHCKEAKPIITDFYNKSIEKEADVKFNLIDMVEEDNKELWYQGDDYTTDENYKSEPKDIKNIDDLQIIGTPSMIRIKDGKVTDYVIGNSDIYATLNNVANEYNIDFNY